MASLIETVNNIFHIITDWLLIILGVLLIVVASRAIDVNIVKYGVIAVGVGLAVAGFWFRYSRMKKKHKPRS
ncbi:hypothetical protein [Desulfogranum marinum]|uniref:hypothetical protein n=1 Tax=Desulfogranum marinum TaxID=453220 RepID=UPI0029C62F49|nr:hypothetical protein [Desulfogranum marinum]